MVAKRYSKYNNKFANSTENYARIAKTKFPKRSYMTLSDHDTIGYIDENNKKIDHLKNERVEQYRAYDYIDPDSVVLELGGRYGTVSAIINTKLEIQTNHVVIEPDLKVYEALTINKERHDSHFSIETSIISNTDVKLIEHGYATRISDAKLGDVVLDTITLDDLEIKYDLVFDTLVADCEGCLSKFFEENLEKLETFNTVIFEQDFPNICDYNYIIRKLKSWNFTNMLRSKEMQYNKSEFVQVWKKL